jgi:hypothetical protein
VDRHEVWTLLLAMRMARQVGETRRMWRASRNVIYAARSEGQADAWTSLALWAAEGLGLVT